jgi:hypothetical protein
MSILYHNWLTGPAQPLDTKHEEKKISDFLISDLPMHSISIKSFNLPAN